MQRSVWVNSETGRLRSVIIGYPDSFVLPAPINQKHTIYHDEHPERPTRDRLRPEFDRFRAALESCGVEVLQPVPVDDVPDQLTPRDIGFVIGDTFVVASMATACRKEEWRGVQGVLEQIPEGNILWTPESVVLEGGDVRHKQKGKESEHSIRQIGLDRIKIGPKDGPGEEILKLKKEKEGQR